MDEETPALCAREILETVPQVMRYIRSEMHCVGVVDLSVPQFRSLNYIADHAGTSLTMLAEHLGLALPSTSKMVNRLVEHTLVARQTSPTDRRCVTLVLTPEGGTLLARAREYTQVRLAERLAALPPAEQTCLRQAMLTLRQTIDSMGKPGDGDDPR